MSSEPPKLKLVLTISKLKHWLAERESAIEQKRSEIEQKQQELASIKSVLALMEAEGVEDG